MQFRGGVWVIRHRRLVLHEAFAILSVFALCMYVYVCSFPDIVSLRSRADTDLKIGVLMLKRPVDR